MNSSSVEVSAPYPPVSLSLMGRDDPADGPGFLATLAGVQGVYRFSEEVEFQRTVGAEMLLPPTSWVLRQHRTQDSTRSWATFEDVAILVSASEHTVLTVFGPSPERVRDVLTRICRDVAFPVDEDVNVRMWIGAVHGSTFRSKRIETEPLEGLMANYPPAVGEALTSLGSTAAPTGTARLLLWHGPPGTGKTSALLGLFHAWRSWCEPNVVTDPERLFADPRYLTDILTHHGAGPGMLTRRRSAPRWNLIACEDADEYLRSDARVTSGPGLGRLLNATDGLLGRGSRSMIMLTTNDELSRLHPAVTRPGRCLSLLEFLPFTAVQASRWLGEQVTSPYTLAELYAQRDGQASRTRQPELRTGSYL